MVISVRIIILIKASKNLPHLHFLGLQKKIFCTSLVTDKLKKDWLNKYMR